MSARNPLFVSIIAAAILTGCGGDDSDNKETFSADKFPAEGVFLPYTVLRSDLTDADTQQTFEIRNGGYGSSMDADPRAGNRFYALTDRGPNADYKNGAYGKGKTFPVADYTPRIGHFEVTADGTIKLLDTILLKRPDGTAITGLPNSSALGGTGETPYHADGSPVLEDDSKPYDADTNPIKLDDYGLDPEGLVAMKDGSFWISDEYGPHMVHFDASGKEIGRINPFAADVRNVQTLPAEFAYRRANRGMEGLTVTPDQSTLVGIMQSTMQLPDKTVQNETLTRIVTINPTTGETHQYLYQQEIAANSNSEIKALSATEFLVLERDGAFLYGGPDGAGAAKPTAMKHVYRIDLSSGTDLESVAATAVLAQDADLGLTINGNTLEQQVLADGNWDTLTANGISPVSKTLVIDMVAAVNYPHDKMEGLWVVDDKHLGVLNDDDFATWSNANGGLVQKMLDSNTIDGNRLYIVPADLSVTK